MTETHCMLDLETLGLAPGCAIVSIGAVAFDPEGYIHDGPKVQFSRSIDVLTCLLSGLTVDPQTVAWWRTQSEAARKALTQEDTTPLARALAAFSEWYAQLQFDSVWANGPAADIVWLEAAYRAIGERAPWSHRDVRCVRTVKALAGTKSGAFVGTPHDPVDDCINQIRDVQRAVRALRGRGAEDAS